MKTLAYLVFIVLFLFAGCAKDEMLTENTTSTELKKAKVPIPMKLDLSGTPDMNSEFALNPIPGLDPNDPASYVTRRMIIGGNGTHLGKLNSNESFYAFETFEYIVENDIPYLSQTGIGFWVAANGDHINYTWWAKANALLPTLDFIGKIELQSGTGKFEGCSGTLDMAGAFDPVTFVNYYKVEGFMKFN